jgi:hypothetical protein
MARFVYERKKKRELAEAFASMKDPIAAAGSGAISEAGDIVKREGRADIAAAGFSRKWQNAFRVNVYPKRPKVSINAAALAFHKIGYAGVFEEGATIPGKPLLWLPLKSTPKRVGGKRATPAQYVRTVGPLFSINRPGKNPLLAGQIALSRRGQKRGGTGRPQAGSKVTLSALRRGAGGAPSRLVPLFVGLRSVDIRDRFSIREIVERAAARLAALYVKHLKPDA